RCPCTGRLIGFIPDPGLDAPPQSGGCALGLAHVGEEVRQRSLDGLEFVVLVVHRSTSVSSWTPLALWTSPPTNSRRSFSSARCRRDFTVPVGNSRTAATSASESSAKYRSTMTCAASA